MSDFELNIRQYLEGLADTFEKTDPLHFLFSLLITAILAGTLALFYIRFANAVSNRTRFARNFLPLALTTMLIITIVKSSFALSLGLVGALSIVRFRSAIKDPEELTYFFFVIGIGVAMGAGQILLGVVAFAAIMLFLLMQAILNGKKLFPTAENMNVHIETTLKDTGKVARVLSDHFKYVDLRRIDERSGKLSLSFVVESSSLSQIEDARSQLTELDPELSLSFIEQRNIAV